MNIIYMRPVVSFCIMMITGIIIAFVSKSLIVVFSLFILFFALFYSFGMLGGKDAVVAVLMLAFYLLGSLKFLAAESSAKTCFSGYNGEYVQVNGFIDSVPEFKGQKVSYIVRTVSIRKAGNNEYRNIKGKLLLSTPYDMDEKLLDYGRKVVFRGKLTEPDGARNPGGFDYRLYLAQKGAGAAVFAYADDIEPGEDVKGNFLIKAGLMIRERIVYVIESSLPEQQAGLMNGMLIGYREGLSDEVKEAFSDAGLMHIMAVSGANVAFLMMPLSLLLKLLRVRRRAANLLIMAFLNLFVCVTGFEASVMRAVFMACVLLVSSMLYREPDVYSAIAVSCIIMLIISPYMIFNIGFQLSYAATLGIVMLYGNISKIITCRLIPKNAADIIAATLAAQLGVLPITLIHFNKISVIAIIPNILSAPLLEITTILGAIMALLGQFSLTLSRAIGYLNNIFLSLLLYITKWSSSVPYASVRTITPSLAAAAVYYIFVWFFLWYVPKKGIRIRPRHWAAVLACAAVIFAVSIMRPGVLDVVFLDVGQGDCIFIRTSSGKTVLIDGGGSSNPETDSKVGEMTVVPFLLDYGTGSIDVAVATHAHSDHIQGLMDVINMISVKRLLIPAVEDLTDFGDLLAAADKNCIPVSACSAGDTVILDDRTTLMVLNPIDGLRTDELSANNTSLVLKLCYGETAVLFMGDAEREVEERLIDDCSGPGSTEDLLDADVIKIGHHGSDTSTSEAFIDEVDPDAAVISAGRNNKFGHPSPEVVARLSERGVKTFRTDECGAVILQSDGRKIKIERTINE